MRPRWMRIQVSCPECGYVTKDENDGWTHQFRTVSGMPEVCGAQFDCPRCKAHFDHGDFWRSHEDKLAHIWSEKEGVSACR
jgi:uncharacterized C2H2 Zn-finger protein